MNPSQPNPADMTTEAASWWARASGPRTRTHVPHVPTEGTVMNDDTSEVTAQRMTAAFNAVQEIAALILDRRDDLVAIPSGRALVERADETRRRMAGEP